MAESVTRTYRTIRASGSYSALSGFMKNRKKKNVTREEAERELRKLHAYVQHKPIRRMFKRLPYKVFFLNSIWAADLKDISSIAPYNNNNHWVLIVVDMFSRKLYGRMLKDKSATSVIPGMRSIFR